VEAAADGLQRGYDRGRSRLYEHRFLTMSSLHTNVTKFSFWFVMYILATPGLVDKLRTELAASGDVDNCPLLNACLQEALRLAAASTGVRVAEADVQLGGYVIRKDAMLLLPTAHLHRAHDTWGSDADVFRPERWEKDEHDGGAGHFRPFGGGVTHCPGRFIARRALRAFVGMLLERYELEMIGAPLEPDMKKPGVGVMNPAGDVKRLRLKLVPRKAL